jgi:hypothetical protein
MNAYSALGENEILRTLEKLGVQRAMVDTGAGKSLGPLSDNRLLSNKSKSNIRLKVAVGDNPIPSDSRGLLDMYVLGADITDQLDSGTVAGMPRCTTPSYAYLMCIVRIGTGMICTTPVALLQHWRF